MEKDANEMKNMRERIKTAEVRQKTIITILLYKADYCMNNVVEVCFPCRAGCNRLLLQTNFERVFLALRSRHRMKLAAYRTRNPRVGAVRGKN